MEKELYSTEELCFMLSTNEKQIRRWINAGYLKPFSNSKRFRFTKKAVEDLIKLGEKYDIYGGNIGGKRYE